ncbi:MAG: hypothetical protein JSR59_10975 [Proteobacteria bacterium]|nr:hypothetical protein [Pseudomonadota bacterium]
MKARGGSAESYWLAAFAAEFVRLHPHVSRGAALVLARKVYRSAWLLEPEDALKYLEPGDDGADDLLADDRRPAA